MIRLKISLLFILLFFSKIYPQPESILNSSEIKLALKKLNTLGSVLYIAAHPDDENTALLSYFSTGRSLRTGYLSMTRGDGGQNLIGSEQGDLLGLIRTQELLDARKIDGAEQFFTRAFDFGFSKNPEETFKFWDKQKILSDVVYIIRKFRPDVIVTRFPITGEGGHGHHTASAILAEDAFNITGTNQFPEQLKFVKPWVTKRLFLNGWLPLLQEKHADLSKLLTVDVGEFNPYLGKSYSEIAAESRSMHKSQGFGTAGSHGESLNYFDLRSGSPVKKDLFEDIDLTWNRVPGAGKVKELLEKAEKEYSPSEPEKIIPTLLQAYNEISKLNEDYWVPIKKNELVEVISSLMGIWYEAIATDYSGVPGEKINITGLLVNRSNIVPKLKSVFVNDGIIDNTTEELKNEAVTKKTFTYTIDKKSPFSQPYWLSKKHDNGTFLIDDQQLIGKAENDPVIKISYVFDILGTEIKVSTPLLFRWVDPVKGEKYRPFEVLPPVVTNFDSKVLLFPDKNSKKVDIHVINNASESNGEIYFNVPDGWNVSPGKIEFSLMKKNEEKIISVEITPPGNVKDNSNALFKITTRMNGENYNYGLTRIVYDHIPIQVYLPTSEIKIVRFNSSKTISNIGYYMGAGDEIPEYLQQLGYNITMLNDNDLLNGSLKKFDAVITGVRAYNTKTVLSKAGKSLADYVNNGGNLLVQYNVNQPLVTDPGLYSITLSRDRVTDEKSAVTFTNKDSELLNYPNKITNSDFDNWIQERGLYFADSWDERYKTLLSCNDPGEKPLTGGLLYTKYGKGNFVYTGYSFFRQLPAGVPGAIRLFVNLFSEKK